MGEDRSFRDMLRGFSFIAPLIAFILAFVIVPVVGTCIDSLYREVTFLPRTFIGIGNYLSLASDPGFRQSLRFTVLFVLASVPLELVLGLAFALLLHRPSPCARGASGVRSHTVGRARRGVGEGLRADLQFPVRRGELHRAAPRTGRWTRELARVAYGAFFTLVAGDVWKTAPFVAILFLAGLSAIPEDLYQQAAVDRAGPLQRFARITLPLLRPVIVVSLLFRTIDALRVFDLIFVLTGGGPGGSTTSLSLYGYDAFTGGDFGYGSAVSVVLFLIAFALSVAYVRIGRFGRELS